MYAHNQVSCTINPIMHHLVIYTNIITIIHQSEQSNTNWTLHQDHHKWIKKSFNKQKRLNKALNLHF